MKYYLSLLFLMILSPTISVAVENKSMVKAGLFLSGSGGTPVGGLLEKPVGSPGIAASVARQFRGYEVGVSSHLSFGPMSGFHLRDGPYSFTGEGTLFSQTLSLYVRKFLFSSNVLHKSERFYIQGGPSAQYNKFRFRKFESTFPRFTRKHKITEEALGVHAAIGLEEYVDSKEEHPTYFQVSYAMNWPRKFSIIDATDFSKVENQYQSESVFRKAIHTIMIEFGILLF